jgi:hypothetical protein
MYVCKFTLNSLLNKNVYLTTKLEMKIGFFISFLLSR